MKRPTRLLAGTAIGLLIAAAPAAAAAPASAHPTLFPVERAVDPIVTGPVPLVRAPLRLAQATDEEREKEEREKTEQEQPAEQPPAETAPQEPAPQEAPAEEPRAEEPAAEEPAPEPPAAEEPAPEQPAPREAPAEEPEPAPAPEEPPAEAPAQEAPAADPQPEAPPAEDAPAEEPAPGAPAAEPEAPAPRDRPAEDSGEAPAQPQPDTPAEPDAPAPEAPADAAPAEPAPAQPDAPDEASPLPENAAPVLDSAKEAPAGDDAGSAGAAPPPAPAGPAGPPPESDAAAQAEVQPAEIEAVTAEEGRRMERAPERRRRERPEDAQVVQEIGDRVVIQIDNRTFVQGDDRRRLSRGARDVYYEELRNGRTRETVVRADGTTVVTVRDRYGDIVRRSRISPDGREYVLVYRDDRDDRPRHGWRDPGRDLPPLRLTVPVSEYILDAGRARSADDYYDFLHRPPVERVERLYGLDEVQRSARIRDKARRIDLDTITFDFGSASIAESEIRKLEALADAIVRLIEENPAETFLIEGHTDAVGSQTANLALSDRRAEAVAEALTAVFGIPPENLATQGYGETYLKVDTQEPERLNRRVAVRRITPLVAPVASAN